MGIIAITIDSIDPSTKYLSLIKRYSNLGLIDIRKKIQNNNYLAETDGDDPDKLQELKSLIDELTKAGASVKIYDSDPYGEGLKQFEEISYEEFINNINRLKEILEEIKDLDDELF
ncbi:hypothetical protein [Terribacillus sp. AE2B 122]|uniref:hypothetical protein n=1 Tax=Terribacillus sp. AE2B 122 TaxID=1331902 RepID=UPI001583186B|nr:hypothetical protein [Terribacillus sp. AE2B 122]